MHYSLSMQHLTPSFYEFLLQFKTFEEGWIKTRRNLTSKSRQIITKELWQCRLQAHTSEFLFSFSSVCLIQPSNTGQYWLHCRGNITDDMLESNDTRWSNNLTCKSSATRFLLLLNSKTDISLIIDQEEKHSIGWMLPFQRANKNKVNSNKVTRLNAIYEHPSPKILQLLLPCEWMPLLNFFVTC